VFEQTRVHLFKKEELMNKLTLKATELREAAEKQRLVMESFTPGTPRYNEERRKFRDMVFNYQVWEATEQDMLKQEHLMWVNRTYELVTGEIAEVARARGYDLVVTQEELDPNTPDAKALQMQILNRKTVYANPEVNLTGAVLKNLNEKFAKAGGADTISFGG
jgi:Skp family chaperone for outer membrane proteins